MVVASCISGHIIRVATHAFAGVGEAADGGLQQRQAQGPNVGGHAVGRPPDALGAHVRDGAHPAGRLADAAVQVPRHLPTPANTLHEMSVAVAGSVERWAQICIHATMPFVQIVSRVMSNIQLSNKNIGC